MSEVNLASAASGGLALRTSRLGRLGVLAIPASLVVAAACLWSGIAVAWPILVFGLGAAALASVVDVREQRLPDVVVIPATVAVTALVVAGGAGEDSWPRTWACLGTGALAGVLFVGVCFVAPTQLGLGDAKLAVLLALTTSWLSPTTTLWAFISAFGLAGLWAAVMLLQGRSGRAGLPLGPFLTLGAVISVVAAIAG